MEFVCERQALQDALDVVGKVVPSRSTRPEVLCFKIEAVDDHVRITGTNGGPIVAMNRLAKVDVVEPGVCLMNAARTVKLIRELNVDRVRVNIDKAGRPTIETIQEGRKPNSFKLPTVNVDEFRHTVSRVESESYFAAPADQLKEILKRTAFAASPEKGRYALNGLYVGVNGGSRLDFVGTDGKRMAIGRPGLETDGFNSGVLPNEAVAALSHFLGSIDKDDEVQVYGGEASFYLTTTGGEFEMYAQKVQGHYPPYFQVIPDVSVGYNKVKVTREALLHYLKVILISTTRESATIMVGISGKDQSLAFSANAADAMEGELSFAAEIENADFEQEFKVNPNYLLDFVKVSDSETITLLFNDDNKTAMVAEDGDVHYILMPIQ